MKLKLLLPFSIVVLWVGTVWGAAGGTAPQTGVFNFPTQCIQESLDGLDARDTNNNTIASAQAQQDLRDIFESGLFSLLTNTELYTYARALSKLQKNLGMGAHAFTDAVAGPCARVVDAVNAGPWKVTLACLLAALFVVFSAVRSYRPASLPRLPQANGAPVVLRC